MACAGGFVKSFVIRNDMPHVLKNCIEFINSLPAGKWRIEITQEKKRRSTQANSYWWSAIVTPMAQHLGYTPDEMHRELCGSFFGWEQKEFRGRKFAVPRRTTTTPDTLDIMTFAELIHHGHNIAAEYGVQVEPSEQAA